MELDLWQSIFWYSKVGDMIGFIPNFVTDIKRTPFEQLTSISPGFGGPIIVTQEKDVLDLMLRNVHKICTGNIISHNISVLNLGYVRYGQYFEKNGYRPNLGICRFTINLNNNWEKIQSNMDKGRIYNLKKGQENDFEIKDEEINDKSLREFYKEYENTMIRLGGDLYPYSFFSSFGMQMGCRVKIFTTVIND